MSNLVSHANQEFRAAGWTTEDGSFKDEMQGLMCSQVLELLELFASHGHSGSSAPYAISLFEKLAKFDPIVPLTGEDWEWNEICDGRTDNITVYQNKRCIHVFKQADRFDGQPYDIQGKVFWEWYDGELMEDEEGFPGKRQFKSFYTSSESFTPITFPYTPTIEYVERQSETE